MYFFHIKELYSWIKINHSTSINPLKVEFKDFFWDLKLEIFPYLSNIYNKFI